MFSFPKPFSKESFKFSCTGCSICCKFDAGYVFLTKDNLDSILNQLKMDFLSFEKEYCRYEVINNKMHLVLKEKSNMDCIMWQSGGCIIHENKPTQCKTFPFWDQNLKKDNWEELKSWCPGIDIGQEWDLKEVNKLALEYKSSRDKLL